MTSRRRCFSSFISGKRPSPFARPNHGTVHSHLEYTTSARDQGYFADFILKGSQQFLCCPAGAQQPAALGAEFDLDAWSAGHD
jgi:hypothetical protein